MPYEEISLVDLRYDYIWLISTPRPGQRITGPWARLLPLHLLLFCKEIVKIVIHSPFSGSYIYSCFQDEYKFNILIYWVRGNQLYIQKYNFST